MQKKVKKSLKIVWKQKFLKSVIGWKAKKVKNVEEQKTEKKS